MAVNVENYRKIISELGDKVKLVAVSKLKTVEEIRELYDLGHRDFGENYVQELSEKRERLPADIRWHFIGHLQSNKVKHLAGFVHLIHGVDSANLLKEINKQAKKSGRQLQVLLQVHIAEEETKFGLDAGEVASIMSSIDQFPFVQVCGLMGMASFSDDTNKIRSEFRTLYTLFNSYCSKGMSILSMGMSGDYQVAIEEGSTMVRIGSLLFGPRAKSPQA